MGEMIEVACQTCGTPNQVDEAAGAPIACASCRSRIVVPGRVVAKPGGPPPLPGRSTVQGLGVPPRHELDELDLPAPVSRRGEAGSLLMEPLSGPAGELEIEELELPAPVGRLGIERPGRAAASAEDLPAPKRASAVASLDLDDLLGPAAFGEPEPLAAAVADLPAPRRSFEPSRRGGEADVSDLLAPKRGTGLASPRPAPVAALDAPEPASDRGPRDLRDLPAPSRAGRVAVPAPRGSMATGDDLPVPRRPIAAPAAGLTDLPAPRAAGVSDLPAPRPAPGVADLPAPRAAAGVADLPAPRAAAGVADLPAPRATGGADLSVPRSSGGGVTDLLTPKGPGGVTDLLTPKRPSGVADLPVPKAAASGPRPPIPTSSAGTGGADLPMPRAGGFSELPMPRPGGFSELPQPRPGGFSELPMPRQELPPELPVPKGFFDDLPQPALPSKTTDLAPKGFFDDLPKPASAPTSAMAPKGFFEDAPGRPSASSLRAKTPSAPGSLFDDIPVPPSATIEDLGLRTPRSPATPTRPPELDLGLANPSIDLGLPPPTRPSHASLPPPIRSSTASIPPLAMPDASEVAYVVEAPPAPPAAPAARTGKAGKADKVAVARDPRRAKILLAAVLGIAVLGSGGFLAYRRYAAAEERREQIAERLAQAKRGLVATEPGHWQRAANAARQVLALDDRNPEAIGLGAEANFASAIDDGINAAARIRTGKQLLAKAAAETINTPAIARARALAALASGKPQQVQQANQLLSDMLANPAAASANLLLYAGWAKAAVGASDTLTTLDRALGAANAHKQSVLYARGQAKFVLGDLAGARADFAAVLDLDKAHLGAQVGLAAALPSAQAQQRESDLMAILQRKDLASGDPRAIARAWLLAGDEARRGGRLESAGERYRKGLEVMPDDVAISLSIAQLELANGRVETARETIDKVLAVAADDLSALLVAAEVDLAQKQGEAARKRLDAVRARAPEHPLQKARLALLSGRLLESTESYDEALKLYREAIGFAGDGDLGPTMAAVALLTRLADRADGSDPTAAAANRAEVESLLQPLTARAVEDSSVAVTLGTAYLAAGNPTKSEEWLARAVAQRPNDLDAKFQLAKAIGKLGRVQDAIDLLTKAFETSPERTDIGAELARTMEEAGRTKEAGALYEKLLAAATVPLALRAHAGKFLARSGDIERAAAQGVAILAQAPEGDAAGYYLRGLGLLHSRKLDDARRDLQRAVNLDHDPDYLDALGHATEELGLSTGDGRFKEESLRAYTQAAELRPAVSALHGIGRLRLERREAQKALEALLRAKELDPSNGDVLYLIGVGYQELRQFKAAAAWFQRANEVKPRAEAEYRFGLAQVELEQAGPAAGALTRATQAALSEEKQHGEKVEWLTDALYLLGRVEHDRHNEGAARRAWETYLGRGPTHQTQVDEVKRLLLGMRDR